MERKTTGLQITYFVFWGLTVVFNLVHSLVNSWIIVGNFWDWEFGNASLALLGFLVLTFVEVLALFSKNRTTRGLVWVSSALLKIGCELIVLLALLDLMNCLVPDARSITLIAFYAIYAISGILDILEGILHGIRKENPKKRKETLVTNL